MHNYWVRLSDACDYERFDDLSELVDHLREFFTVGPFERIGKYSVQTPTSQEISLYVGDKDAQPIRRLTNEELAELNVRVFG